MNFQTCDRCIGGDFNAVYDRSKRKGIRVSYDGKELQEFNDFISSMDLIDIMVIGNHFTWFNLVGSAGSRLYSFLVTNGLLEV